MKDNTNDIRSEETAKTTAAKPGAEEKARKKETRRVTAEDVCRYVEGANTGVVTTSQKVCTFYMEFEDGCRYNSCRVMVLPEPGRIQVAVELPVRVLDWEAGALMSALSAINDGMLENYECFWADPLTERIYYRLLAEYPAAERDVGLIIATAVKTAGKYLEEIVGMITRISKTRESEPDFEDAPADTMRRENRPAKRRPGSRTMMDKFLGYIGLTDASDATFEDPFEDDDDDLTDL